MICGVVHSFLYADPTPSALQVFLKRPGVPNYDTSGLPAEQGLEEGIWINADPIPGCIVCNIGESEPRFCGRAEYPLFTIGTSQCGRHGQMVFIVLLSIALFIEAPITGEI